MDKRMSVVKRAISRLPLWQRAAAGALVILIVLTWLATCVVMASFFGP